MYYESYQPQDSFKDEKECFFYQHFNRTGSWREGFLGSNFGGNYYEDRFEVIDAKTLNNDFSLIKFEYGLLAL